MDRPLANSYWVVPGRLLAGEHPAGRVEKHRDAGRARVLELVAAGISCFVDLTEEGECIAYQAMLPATVSYLRHSIRDQDVPRRSSQMRRIQDEIAAALAAGRNVYVHCRAGIGRTGTVAGCFLVEQGRDGERALSELNTLWTEQCARAATWPAIPQTLEQANYIREWAPRVALSGRERRAAILALAPESDGAPEEHLATLEFTDRELAPVRKLRERFQGALQGLAIGDALAAATQFRRGGSFAPVGDLLGGGPFDLPRGAWSDDAAMALCLAESLIVRGSFDAQDQLETYTRWQREGYRSATGQCLGITAATARALATAQWRGEPPKAISEGSALAGEALSRVAPVVMHFFATPEAAVTAAADSARLTSPSPLVLDSCRLLAAMLHAALRGEPKERVLSPDLKLFGDQPLREPVAAILTRDPAAPPPASDGGALAALELARLSLAGSADFREGALMAVNFGGDADVIGAVYGQLAGAHYGLKGIPRSWRQALAHSEMIVDLGDGLLQSALVALGDAVAVT